MRWIDDMSTGPRRGRESAAVTRSSAIYMQDHLAGLSVIQIAERHAVSRQAVYRGLSRARRRSDDVEVTVHLPTDVWGSLLDSSHSLPAIIRAGIAALSKRSMPPEQGAVDKIIAGLSTAQMAFILELGDEWRDTVDLPAPFNASAYTRARDPRLIERMDRPGGRGAYRLTDLGVAVAEAVAERRWRIDSVKRSP